MRPFSSLMKVAWACQRDPLGKVSVTVRLTDRPGGKPRNSIATGESIGTVGWSTTIVAGIGSPSAHDPWPSVASAALPMPNHLRVGPVIRHQQEINNKNARIRVCFGAKPEATDLEMSFG